MFDAYGWHACAYVAISQSCTDISGVSQPRMVKVRIFQPCMVIAAISQPRMVNVRIFQPRSSF